MGHPGTAGRADALAARSHSATLASTATLALTGATLTSPCSRSLAARACSVSSGHDAFLLSFPQPVRATCAHCGASCSPTRCPAYPDSGSFFA